MNLFYYYILRFVIFWGSYLTLSRWASKNKLWFPLNYDADNNNIRFKAQQKTIIELSDDNKYIVFKDDETNIPIIGVYFYSPVCLLDDYLKVAKKLKQNKRILNQHMVTTKLNNKISYSYILKEGISEIKGGINVLCDMNYPQEIIDKTIKLLWDKLV